MKRHRPSTDSAALLKVARELLGWEISYRTWTSWRSRLGIKPNAQVLSEQEKADLIAFAALRKESPRKRITLLDVRGAQRDRTKSEWLKTICNLPEGSLLSPCKGHDLPERLYQVLGIRVAESTLYEWGRLPGMLPYKRQHEYTSTQVGQWINFAKKQRQGKTNATRRTKTAA